MTYELDVFITIPLYTLPDQVRVFAGTVRVTPTHTLLTWQENNEERSARIPPDQRVVDWVYHHLTAA